MASTSEEQFSRRKAFKDVFGRSGEDTSSNSESEVEESEVEESEDDSWLNAFPCPDGADDNTPPLGNNEAEVGEKRGRPRKDRSKEEMNMLRRRRDSLLNSEADKVKWDKFHGDNGRAREQREQAKMSVLARPKKVARSPTAPVEATSPASGPVTPPPPGDPPAQDLPKRSTQVSDISDAGLGAFEHIAVEKCTWPVLVDQGDTNLSAFEIHETPVSMAPPPQDTLAPVSMPTGINHNGINYNGINYNDQPKTASSDPPLKSDTPLKPTQTGCVGSRSNTTRLSKRDVGEEARDKEVMEEHNHCKEEFEIHLREMRNSVPLSSVVSVNQKVMDESNFSCGTCCHPGAFLSDGQKCHGKVDIQHEVYAHSAIEDDEERFKRLFIYKTDKGCVDGRVKTHIFLSNTETIVERATICAYKGNRVSPADFGLLEENNAYDNASKSVSIEASDGYWVVLEVRTISDTQGHFVPSMKNPGARIAVGTLETSNVEVQEACDGSFIVVATAEIKGGDELLYAP